jgi:branched-chain amino acid transport system permease protein
VERFVMRPLVNQPDIILFMATIGLTYFLIGFGEFVFGGEPKQMITEELGLPTGSTAFEFGERGLVILQHIDIAAAVIAVIMVASLGCSSTRRASAARCARWPTTTRQRFRSAFRSTRSGPSSGSQPASWRWQRASCGAQAPTCPSRWKSSPEGLPVLILGGFTSIPAPSSAG